MQQALPNTLKTRILQLYKGIKNMFNVQIIYAGRQIPDGNALCGFGLYHLHSQGVPNFYPAILIYCFVKSFLNTPVWPTAIGVLIFSFTIEVLQYFDLVALLGLQDSKIARIVIGTSFAWADLLAYTVGIVVLLFFERKKA